MSRVVFTLFGFVLLYTLDKDLAKDLGKDLGKDLATILS